MLLERMPSSQDALKNSAGCSLPARAVTQPHVSMLKASGGHLCGTSQPQFVSLSVPGMSSTHHVGKLQETLTFPRGRI